MSGATRTLQLTSQDAIEQLDVMAQELALIHAADAAQHELVLILVGALALQVGCRQQHRCLAVGTANSQQPSQASASRASLLLECLDMPLRAHTRMSKSPRHACRTCCSQHRHDGAHAVVIVLLAGQLLTAQPVGGHNLTGTVTRLQTRASSAVNVTQGGRVDPCMLSAGSEWQRAARVHVPACLHRQAQQAGNQA
jgi:hypothetical protein